MGDTSDVSVNVCPGCGHSKHPVEARLCYMCGATLVVSGPGHGQPPAELALQSYDGGEPIAFHLALGAR